MLVRDVVLLEPDKRITETCANQILFCDRYHIAGTRGVFYSREPYANIDAVHVTRFIGLAPVGNADKQVFYLTFTKLLTKLIMLLDLFLD